MDQIFERLETLLKSLWNQNENPSGGAASGGVHTGRMGDPDLDDAMEELDAFLKDDKEEQERLERERRARAEARSSNSRSAHKPHGAAERSGRTVPSPRLAADFRTLGLTYGAPMTEVKTAYKRLLKQHHPDRHGASPEAQREATERSARINEAYAHIEAWAATGELPEDV